MDNSQIAICFYDYEHQATLADLHMASNQATRGVKPKGFRFIDKHHMIASFASYSILPDTCSQNATQLEGKNVKSSVVLIKMNFSLDDIAKGKRGPADDSEFAVLDSYLFDFSSIDGLAYDNGIAIVADQYNDCVLIFDVNVNAKKLLTLRGEKITGTQCHMAFSSRKTWISWL